MGGGERYAAITAKLTLCYCVTACHVQVRLRQLQAPCTLHLQKPHPPSHSLGVVRRLSDIVFRKVQLASPVIWGRVL